MACKVTILLVGTQSTKSDAWVPVWYLKDGAVDAWTPKWYPRDESVDAQPHFNPTSSLQCAVIKKAFRHSHSMFRHYTDATLPRLPNHLLSV